MPGMSRYDYVKYYAYTPGTGNAGTSNNYTLEWVDDFDTLDATRWDQSEDGSVGPLCTFRGANVEVVGGELQLTITEPNPVVPTRPVTFGVDASSLPLSPTDVIYVAGSFNGWCANCHAINDDDGDLVWTTALDLPLGQHQFQYVVNGWEALSANLSGELMRFQPVRRVDQLRCLGRGRTGTRLRGCTVGTLATCAATSTQTHVLLISTATTSSASTTC